MATATPVSRQGSAAPNARLQQASLSTDAWRLLVEAEIDTVVRELRKNALWAEVVERDGIGALWVGGSRWPGIQASTSAASARDASATPVLQQPQPTSGAAASESSGANDGQSAAPGRPPWSASKIKHYMDEFASRRTFGRAGVGIGLASFADRDDEGDDDEYAVGRIMMLESFLLLREIINGVADPRLVDAQTLLDPFLLVIRDAETTGPITRCTLVSVQRFINHGIIDFSQRSAVPALLELARAATHCRFEATDAASDEAVLMQILNVLGSIVLSNGGPYLTDEVVCEIMETVLSMSCQMRLSEMLRKTAESTLFTLVTFVFGKLNDMHRNAARRSRDLDGDASMDPESKPAADAGQGSAAESGEVSMIMPSASKLLVNMDRSKHRAANLAHTPGTSRSASTPGSAADLAGSETGDSVKVEVVDERAADAETTESPEDTDAPVDNAAEDMPDTAESVSSAQAVADAGEAHASFSLPAIRELYRVLVTLTNPRDLQYTDSMRLLALNTLQVAFQTAGSAMAGFATLRELTLGDLSHYLLLILQRDQPSLISPALRVLYLLFASHRRDTKGHLELFLCQTLGRVMAPPVLEHQGSRSSLRLSSAHGSGHSTPKIGAPRAPAKSRTLADSKEHGKAASDVGLGISELHEKGKPASGSSLHGQGAGLQGGRRRRSTASLTAPGDLTVQQSAVPHMSPLLEAESSLTYAQEIELYNEASLRKGVRGRVATHETRRQLLEGLHHLIIGDESLITDLWVNYDCDMQRGNMYDFLISFITQRAVPWPEVPDDSESEAFLDMLLFYLTRIANRAGVAPPQGKWAQLLGLPPTLQSKAARDDQAADGRQQQSPSISKEALADMPLTLAQLQDRKKHKETMSRAAQLFNEKPKDGIAYLQKVGALPPENSTELTQQLARFLYETPTINKKLLGEFLAKPSNLEVLQTYIQLFDFSGRRLDEAMRSLLGTFRLPGESQQIERIMETFSAAYFASDPADVANKDSAFILAYAIIMLNTDQHSPQVKNRMKFEDFARNLRGVNDGEDFRQGFLMDIYNAIRDREIVFPEEHEGEAGFDYAWREVCASDSSAGAWASTRGRTTEYDRGLLAATWPRLLRALVRILTYFTSDHTLRLALSGLHALVASAAHYGLHACVDESLRLLVQMTGLADSSLHSDLLSPQVLVKSYNRYSLLDPESPTSPLGVIAEGFAGSDQLEKLQEQEDKSIQLTRAALEFGKDYRGQIAFIALFEFASQWPSDISKQGWLDILDAVRVVVDADLLPHKLLATSDLLVDNMWVPRISTLQAMDAAQERIKARRLEAGSSRQGPQQGGGLFSAISSFWGGSAPEQTAAASSRRELRWRWRESPELLANLVGRGKLAVQASSIDSLGRLVDLLGASLPAFLAVLAEHFPRPPPSQPNSPGEESGKADGDGPAGQGPSVSTSLLPQSESALGGAEPTINYSPASIYFFELAVSLVESSPVRAPAIWLSIEQSVHHILEHADTLYHFSLKRVVSGLLRIAVTTLEKCSGDDAADDTAPLLDAVERVLRCLGLLRDSTDATFDVVALELAVGIGRLIDADGKALVSVPSNWEILRQLIKRLAHTRDSATLQTSSADIAHRSLMIVVEIAILLKCGAVDPAVYFADVLDVLAAFMPSDRELLACSSSAAVAKAEDGGVKQVSAVEVASKLVTLLYDMQEMAKSRMADDAAQWTSAALSSGNGYAVNMSPPSVSPMTAAANAQQQHREPSIASFASTPHSTARQAKATTPLSMWLGSMNALAAYSCTAHREVRQLACSKVQRAISTSLGGSIDWVVSAFHRVLFPLMDTLLRADLLADRAMEDTHARCISMLAMFFLHNVGDLQNATESVAVPMSPKLKARHRAYSPTPPAAAAFEGGERDAAEEAVLPLNQIWLRLIGVFSVYIHTGNLAATSRSSGFTGVQSSEAAERRLSSAEQGEEAPGGRRGHLGVLAEMAEENIKNCMLVLDSMGIFGVANGDSEADRESNQLWRQSWEQLSQVSPQLKAHVFPSTTAAAEGSPAAQETDAVSQEKPEPSESADQGGDLGNNEVAAAGDDAAVAEDGPKAGSEKPKNEEPVQEPKKKKHPRQNIIIRAGGGFAVLAGAGAAAGDLGPGNADQAPAPQPDAHAANVRVCSRSRAATDRRAHRCADGEAIVGFGKREPAAKSNVHANTGATRAVAIVTASTTFAKNCGKANSVHTHPAQTPTARQQHSAGIVIQRGQSAPSAGLGNNAGHPSGFAYHRQGEQVFKSVDKPEVLGCPLRVYWQGLRDS
ncbi:hypothetical protein GQ54DRAFT_336661 [Martensiomyces pterosporus]|nr:hypothetical protein GQ54DRAFT_336661 [Martensiomyces pterosporus]